MNRVSTRQEATAVPRNRRRGRPATGSLKWKRNHRGDWQWFARVTLADGSRPEVPLDPKIPHERRDLARACASEVSAKARVEGRVSTAVQETVEEYSARWLDAREARGLKTVSDDRSRLRCHVLPIIGSLDVRHVVKLDLERLVANLDERVRGGAISWKTAQHAWSLVTSMFDDASMGKRLDLRVRDDNPAQGVRGPDIGERKAKVYLYPSEFAQLVSSPRVPLRWRRLFAMTTYLYARAGEINALTWEDVDLERGVVHIHASVNRRTGKVSTTKTAITRRVPIERELMPLLSALHDARGKSARVSPVDATDKKLSRQLRRCLKLAGVTRADLFADDASRKPITFHDLRATGITWCAVRGDEPLRIMQRAGHRDFSTTQGYIREAENLREANFGEPFPPLPAALLAVEEEPGPAEAAPGWAISARNSGSDEKPSAKDQCGRPVMVEAPGIEPGSENFEATCVYVRIQPFESSRFAPTGELSSGLFTCLISPQLR